MIFEHPIVCTTKGWTRVAWTENGLNDLRRCARHQRFAMTEKVDVIAHILKGIKS